MALMTTEGVLFLSRWVYFFAGITWMGLLYYFNFVQTPFFAEVDPAVRGVAIQKLVPRALWRFRCQIRMPPAPWQAIRMWMACLDHAI
jgi:hypothetical protein